MIKPKVEIDVKDADRDILEFGGFQDFASGFGGTGGDSRMRCVYGDNSEPGQPIHWDPSRHYMPKSLLGAFVARFVGLLRILIFLVEFQCFRFFGNQTFQYFQRSSHIFVCWRCVLDLRVQQSL